MKMQIGENCHGFELQGSRQVKEINATAHTFRHKKSGARLLFLECGDDNKVFSVTFRTPPPDDTGVPHILEHSVLCGSRKFPLKEPFVELIKGSLNTYLNAMTFADKTMYPVASQNDKDFHNLMDVYLDAVFFPNIYNYPEILMQEGWHYELDDPAGELTYKGVVYNEMKGVFSSPEAVLERKAQEILFPDTPYGRESGGDPDHIPALTQEDFEAFHRKYYHPANSYIYMYGDLQIEEHLKFINEEYLVHFETIPVESEIAVQAPFAAPKSVTVEYPISSTERAEDKTFLSLHYVVGRGTDVETCLAFNILKHMLLGTPAAPLKKALIDAGIGKDVSGNFYDGILQPTFNVVARNANAEQAGKFKDIVEHTLRRLVDQGLDKRLVEASINSREFQLREANYGTRPKGLGYNIECLDSWLYDGAPTAHLEYDAALESIKRALTEPYFEQLIDKYLLQNNHSALFVVKPARGLAEARAQEIRKELADHKARLTKEELDVIVAQTQKLKAWQMMTEDPEKLKTIPLLSLEDIERKTQRLPLSERREQDVQILAHPLFTNHIAYVNCYFDTSGVPQDLLPYIYLLTGILSKIGTEKYDYAELSNQINIHTGGISAGAIAFPEQGNDTVFYPKLVIKSKSLVNKLPELMELLGEIMGRSKFDDAKRMQDLVYEIKARSESIILELGQSVATSRVLSFCSPVAKYNEIGILTFYRFLSELTGDLSGRMAEIVSKLKQTADLIFNKQGLLVSVTVSDDDYAEFREVFPVLVNYLGDKTVTPVKYAFDLNTQREGLMTSSKVQYVVQGFNFKRLGHRYTGSMKVLETILRYDYLWNRVRVQGGAYGGFAQFDRTGNMICGSYRDPNLRETLAIYNETSDYLENFQVSDREMLKYIIGTISTVDTPLTPSMKGERAASMYIQKITWDTLQREREEILATRQEDIRALAAPVADVMKQNCICVLGGEEKIKACNDCFDTMVHVLE